MQAATVQLFIANVYLKFDISAILSGAQKKLRAVIADDSLLLQ